MPHLKLGDTHRAVKHIIRALKKHLYRYFYDKPPWMVMWCERTIIRTPVSKSFTRILESALYFFQDRAGLKRTGECDAATWVELRRYL